ncbi:hypothetical protein GCM10007417_04620 [Glycocaulis alkaliphilus]|nr:hypothetical protein GCM10007417_04620 [Glycocaulis alkaliphilus]
MNIYRIAVTAIFLAFVATTNADAQNNPSSGACLDFRNCNSGSPGLNDPHGQIFDSSYLNYLAGQFGARLSTFQCLAEECQMPKAECEAYCDRIYNNIIEWCRSLRTSQERAVCYGDASAEYGRCLARCPRS